MFKKVMILAGLVALIGFVPVLADGPPCDGDGPHGPHGMRQHEGGFGPGPFLGPRIADAIDLTTAQRDQIHAIFDQARQDTQAVREQLRLHRQAMEELWAAETPDRDAIIAKMAEGAALRKQVEERMIDARLAARQVLTADQQAKLRELRSEARERFESRGEDEGGPHRFGKRGRGPGTRF